MDLKKFKQMDTEILVSIINMKIRNDFSDIDDLVSFYDISKEELFEKINKSDYRYNEKIKQFHSSSKK